MRHMRGRLAGIAVEAHTGAEAVIYTHTPEWDAVLEWCEFHGIDPMLVPAGTRVVRDEVRRCIRYVRIVQDDQGRKRQRGFDGTDHPASDWITAPAIEQGEAPPLPYPGVIQRALVAPITERPTP